MIIGLADAVERENNNHDFSINFLTALHTKDYAESNYFIAFKMNNEKSWLM